MPNGWSAFSHKTITEHRVDGIVVLAPSNTESFHASVAGPELQRLYDLWLNPELGSSFAPENVSKPSFTQFQQTQERFVHSSDQTPFFFVWTDADDTIRPAVSLGVRLNGDRPILPEGMTEFYREFGIDSVWIDAVPFDINRVEHHMNPDIEVFERRYLCLKLSLYHGTIFVANRVLFIVPRVIDVIESYPDVDSSVMAAFEATTHDAENFAHFTQRAVGAAFSYSDAYSGVQPVGEDSVTLHPGGGRCCQAPKRESHFEGGALP